MKFPNLKVFTAAAILMSTSAGQALAETDTNAASAADSEAAAAPQAPAATTPAYPPPYRGYRQHRYGYDRGWSRPFGNDGPTFHGPWNRGRGRGSGFGFGNGPGGWGSGPSFGSGGPGWDSGPRYYDRPGFGPRRGYHDRPFGPRPYHDRGPRFGGPDWDDSGMSFGW